MRACSLVTLSSVLLTSCSSHLPLLSIDPSPPGEQRLQPGDFVRIDVWRQPDLSGEYAIGPDSTLVHPLYQHVVVGGLTLPEAREQIDEFLRTFQQDVRFVVEPLRRVTVSGEVRQPNLYYLTAGTTVAEAIARAGGPTPQARLSKVRFVRGGTEAMVSLTEDFVTYSGLLIMSGDQILVERQREFNIWRDLVAPVTTLALLVLTLIRISNENTR